MLHRLVVTLVSLSIATAVLADDGARAPAQAESRVAPGVQRWMPQAKRGFLGVQVQGLTPELRSFFGAPRDRGVIIAAVSKDTPATRADLRVGDVIIAVGGKAIDSPSDLVHEIGFRSDGEKVDIEVMRKDRSETLTVTIAERQLPSFPFQHRRFWTPEEPEHETTEKRLQQLEQRLNKLETR